MRKTADNDHCDPKPIALRTTPQITIDDLSEPARNKKRSKNKHTNLLSNSTAFLSKQPSSVSIHGDIDYNHSTNTRSTKRHANLYFKRKRKHPYAIQHRKISCMRSKLLHRSLNAILIENNSLVREYVVHHAGCPLLSLKNKASLCTCQRSFNRHHLHIPHQNPLGRHHSFSFKNLKNRISRPYFSQQNSIEENSHGLASAGRGERHLGDGTDLNRTRDQSNHSISSDNLLMIDRKGHQHSKHLPHNKKSTTDKQKSSMKNKLDGLLGKGSGSCDNIYTLSKYFKNNNKSNYMTFHGAPSNTRTTLLHNGQSSNAAGVTRPASRQHHRRHHSINYGDSCSSDDRYYNADLDVFGSHDEYEMDDRSSDIDESDDNSSVATTTTSSTSSSSHHLKHRQMSHLSFATALAPQAECKSLWSLVEPSAPIHSKSFFSKINRDKGLHSALGTIMRQSPNDSSANGLSRQFSSSSQKVMSPTSEQPPHPLGFHQFSYSNPFHSIIASKKVVRSSRRNSLSRASNHSGKVRSIDYNQLAEDQSQRRKYRTNKSVSRTVPHSRTTSPLSVSPMQSRCQTPNTGLYPDSHYHHHQPQQQQQYLLSRRHNSYSLNNMSHQTHYPFVHDPRLGSQLLSSANSLISTTTRQQGSSTAMTIPTSTPSFSWPKSLVRIIFNVMLGVTEIP